MTKTKTKTSFLNGKKIFFHTADCATTSCGTPSPCVQVYTEDAEGEMEHIIAEFYPLPGEEGPMLNGSDIVRPWMRDAENRAVAFVNLLRLLQEATE